MYHERNRHNVATQFNTDSFYLSSITYQIPYTGDHDPANWTYRLNGSDSQCSHFHHKTNNFDDSSTLDLSLYDIPMADPVLRPIVEDRWRSWNYEAPDAQPPLDQDPPPCDQPNDEMASNLTIPNQPDHPGIYSLSISSTLSSGYQHSVLSRSNSTSSPTSLLEEKPSKELASSYAQKLSNWKALSSSTTVEDDLLNSSEKRQSTTSDQQLYARKKTRKSHAAKATRHSLVEKRYRTKINDSIRRLRDRVPSLRVTPKNSEDYAYQEGPEKLDRPQAASKFDKATVVSKAIEYIEYLEMCNKRLSEKNVVLVKRVSAIQRIASMIIQRPK